MPNDRFIQHRLRDHGLENENLAEIVACATSNGDDTYLGDFIEDLGRAPWFRTIVERWPMLGYAIWASPEIMESEPTVEEARAILLRDGASGAGEPYDGDAVLHPVDPAVLDWLEGRTWITYAAISRTLPTTIDALRVLGPDALPATQEEWTTMVRTLDVGAHVLGQLGSRPAQMLQADGLRNLMALVSARMELTSSDSVDFSLATEIARCAFGPAGEHVVDDFKTDVDRVVFAEAVARMPIPRPVASIPSPGA
ncbi:hypothetical protein [Methylobacterium radiotolerans]|uniref:hypothetical protein n=1 Tax=Methylobacterium radiotolerans TaxID=31998 RepID=UPI0038CF47B1